MHIHCLDHIINLAVQAFLKNIKVVTVETNDNESEDNDESDDDDGVVSFVDSMEGTFAGTISKIRGLAKAFPTLVFCKCNVQIGFNSSQNVSFVRYILSAFTHFINCIVFA